MKKSQLIKNAVIEASYLFLNLEPSSFSCTVKGVMAGQPLFCHLTLTA
jgi:hypothetical protein